MRPRRDSGELDLLQRVYRGYRSMQIRLLVQLTRLSPMQACLVDALERNRLCERNGSRYAGGVG